MTAPRTDPPTPDPHATATLADAVKAILDSHRKHHHSMDPDSRDGGDAGAILFELQIAYDALAALPSAPDQRLRLREALDKVVAIGCIRQFWGARRSCDESDDGRELCGICALRVALSEATTSPEPTLDVETLAEWLHDLDGTQHYITHETSYDGDDMEVVACVEGVESHMDDARDLLARLRGPA